MSAQAPTAPATANGHRTVAAGHETVFVDQYIDGILDPSKPMLGPVRDGGHIIANTAPGCWGPMITPEIRGGHEVTKPVAVAGAEIGDAIVIRIKEITVTSLATSSGNDQMMSGRFLGDPYVAGKCPDAARSTRRPCSRASARPRSAAPNAAPTPRPLPLPTATPSPLTPTAASASRWTRKPPRRSPTSQRAMPPCPRTRSRTRS